MAFQEAEFWIGPRDVLEQEPAFRQTIPYVLLRVGDRFIRYVRTRRGSEARLHDSMSIGLGGHIELSDITSSGNCVDLPASFRNAAQREVSEELGEVDCIAQEWMGVLVDNDSEVGRVHIGVVGLWTLRSTPAGVTEDAIGEVTLCSIEELERCRAGLEPWSEMLLAYLKARLG